MSNGLLCRLFACLKRLCQRCAPEAYPPSDDQWFADRYYGSKIAGRPYVVVKFEDHLGIPYGDPYIEGQGGKLDGLLRQLRERFGEEVKIRPLYRGVSEERFRNLIERAKLADRSYRPPDLLSYFQITGSAVTKWDAIAGYLNDPRVQAEHRVERAYTQRPGPDPGLVDYSGEALFPQQRYLHNAVSPAGMRVRAVWDADRAGADGTNVNFVDVEQGWMLGHEDLPKIPREEDPSILDPAIRLVTWPVPDGPKGMNYPLAAPHGTATLGILCMQPGASKMGGVGAAPKATGYVVSCVDLPATDPPPPPDPPVPVCHEAAITAAAYHLASLRPEAERPLGDVLVIERQIQVDDNGGNPVLAKWGPLELLESNFWAIRTATAFGIIVIEAGGNGAGPAGGEWPPINLDNWPTVATSPKPFTPRDAHNRVPQDSLAIIVSAASASAWGGPTPTPYAPIGLRIDCFGWGNPVITSWTDTLASTSDYTTSTAPEPTAPPSPAKVFGYTSAATAMVAGAAIVLQGMARASGKGPLTPDQMRKALSDRTLNTVCAAQPLIGAMPNLANLWGPLNAGTLHAFNPPPLPEPTPPPPA